MKIPFCNVCKLVTVCRGGEREREERERGREREREREREERGD